MIRIAIVDDDKKFMAIYKQIIASLFSEHHVKTEINDFFSGKEFIKSLSITKYDLVFMDIDMPEVSGIDIAAELRNNKQNLDIIFVSAHPHFVFEAIRFTPYRFIRKSNFKSETKEEQERIEKEIDDLSPSIVRDASKCIMCKRCVATCKNIQKISEITQTPLKNIVFIR